MDIRIKTTNYKMTPRTSEYLDQRLAAIEKLLGKKDTAMRCEVEIGLATGHHKHSNYQYFAEIQLIRPRAARIVARNNEPTINAAIDRAKDELVSQLRKQIAEHKSKVRKGATRAKGILRNSE